MERLSEAILGLGVTFIVLWILGLILVANKNQLVEGFLEAFRQAFLYRLLNKATRAPWCVETADYGPSITSNPV